MKLRLGVLAALVVAFGGLLRAEDAPGVNNAAPSPEQLKKQLLEKFDANGDGNLTGQELLNAQQAMIKQFGTGGGAGGFNFDEFKKKFDRDGDGQLNAQEQAAAMAAFQKARASGGGAPATGVLPGGGGAGALPGGIPAGGGFGVPARGEGGKVRGREAMIKRFDRNGDGKLSDDEKAEAQKALKAKKGEARPAAGKLSEALKKFDEDGDGKLSEDEKAAAKKDLAEKRKGKKPE